MVIVQPLSIRNVGLFGHMGTGKTSLAESLLHTAGAISRLGRVDDGTSTSDYDPDEQRRRMSANLALLPLTWHGTKINIIDVPGYADFVGEMRAAQRVVDGAILVSCAVGGLEVGTEQAWVMCQHLGLPRIAVVNRMDRENADFEGVVSQFRDQFGESVVAAQLPIGTRDTYSGHVDLITRTAVMYSPHGTTMTAVPPELDATVRRLADRLVEVVAETDEDLIVKFLEGATLTAEELGDALCRAVRNGKVTPVFATSATSNMGSSALLEAIDRYLPSPVDVVPTSATRATGGDVIALPADTNGPLAALVFKTLADPFIGKLTFFRVYSGTLLSDTAVWNAAHERDERIGTLLSLRGKTHSSVDSIGAGDIGAVAKLAVTTTGDTLCGRDRAVHLAPPRFPEPLYSAAIEAKSRTDQVRMSNAMQRIQEEDPTIRAHRDEETGQMVLSGMGDSHLDTTIEKIKRKFGADVRVIPMRIPYRETLKSKTRAEGKHVRQTGGSGQFGVCTIEVEPVGRGTGYQFVDRIVGGVISGGFRAAVDKGIQDKMADGVLAGYPMVDIRVTLVDGKEHAVDSSEMAFKIAGSMAFQKAVEQAGALLLEPIMSVAITIPASNTGDIMGDLSTKRGRVMGMNPNGDATTTIDAEVPMAEVVTYATSLRSITQGRGTFTTSFSHYEEMPAIAAQKVIENAKTKADRR